MVNWNVLWGLHTSVLQRKEEYPSFLCWPGCRCDGLKSNHHFESLSGGSGRERSYSYTLDWEERSSTVGDGRPLPPSAQLWVGHTWSRKGGRGHPPSQPDQQNQLWRSMGWQMLQPDHPHIQEWDILYPLFLSFPISSSMSLSFQCVSLSHLCFCWFLVILFFCMQSYKGGFLSFLDSSLLVFINAIDSVYWLCNLPEFIYYFL